MVPGPATRDGQSTSYDNTKYLYSAREEEYYNRQIAEWLKRTIERGGSAKMRADISGEAFHMPKMVRIHTPKKVRNDQRMKIFRRCIDEIKSKEKAESPETCSAAAFENPVRSLLKPEPMGTSAELLATLKRQEQLAQSAVAHTQQYLHSTRDAVEKATIPVIESYAQAMWRTMSPVAASVQILP
eukprot:1189015-Amphidinium_carterae.1